ncbi:MAG: acyl-CoA thioesterase [Victivallales bacterium]|nr:acyl-CoA thioesterase [Victivallales bacterium]
MKAQLLKIRIDWSELDLLGHVNNVSIVKYCQAARIEFITGVGLPLFPGMEFGPIEAATSLQFMKQLRYPGTVSVYTFLKETKHTSFILEHHIYTEDGQLAVVCTEVIVCFDFVNQVKVNIPDRIHQQMQEYISSLTAELPSA